MRVHSAARHLNVRICSLGNSSSEGAVGAHFSQTFMFPSSSLLCFPLPLEACLEKRTQMISNPNLGLFLEPF